MTRQRRQAALAAVLLGAAVAFVYGPLLRDLVRDWAVDGTYSHAFLVAPLAAYLAWDRRRALAAAPIAPTNAGLAVLVASLALFAAGTIGVELFVARISLVGVLAGIVLFVCGPRHLRLLAVPLALLALIIPLPAVVLNEIALPLQSMTSRAAAMLLETSAVPVLREGNILRLPKTSLEVEQACSGVRSIVSLVTIGSVIAYLSHRSLGGRIALASLTVPLAVAANAVRVAALGIGAYYYGVDIDRPLLHEAAGVAIFAATCSTLFVADRRLPSW